MTESANCHSIADESEHPGRYEFGICQVADRDVLCPAVEVFGAAQESVSGLRSNALCLGESEKIIVLLLVCEIKKEPSVSFQNDWLGGQQKPQVVLSLSAAPVHYSVVFREFESTCQRENTRFLSAFLSPVILLFGTPKPPIKSGVLGAISFS